MAHFIKFPWIIVEGKSAWLRSLFKFVRFKAMLEDFTPNVNLEIGAQTYTWILFSLHPSTRSWYVVHFPPHVWTPIFRLRLNKSGCRTTVTCHIYLSTYQLVLPFSKLLGQLDFYLFKSTVVKLDRVLPRSNNILPQVMKQKNFMLGLIQTS